MPLQKRVVYDPASYHKKDVFEESTQDSLLQDHHMSRMLGTMHQLAYFSSFALEIFQNLAILTEDLGDRIKIAAVRTNTLYGELKSVDRQVASIDDESHVSAIPGLSKFLQSREMFTPQLFNKATNYCSISQQYRVCRAPPQLWRIEVFAQEDCFRNFSNPGFFFQEWIRSEIIRQQYKKEEKKKNKLLKKLQRQERKKLKEAAAEEELYNTAFSTATASVNVSANVSLSGVTDKRNKSMLIFNKESDRRKGGAMLEGRLQDDYEEVRHGEEEGDFEGVQDVIEDEDPENAAITTAAVLAAKAQAKSKEKSATASAMKGLAHLFGRKPKGPFPVLDEDEAAGDSQDPLSDSASGPGKASVSKTETMSMQILNLPSKHRRKKGGKQQPQQQRNIRSEEEEFPENNETDEEELLRRPEEQNNSEHQVDLGVPAGRPMSYMDELTAAAAITTRRQSVLQRDRDAIGLGVSLGLGDSLAKSSGSAIVGRDGAHFSADHALKIQIQPIPRHDKKTPATMKIGNKFLSSAVTGNKPATTSTTAAATSAPAPDDSQPFRSESKLQRRGSHRVNVVTDASSVVAQKEVELNGVDGADWETQRRNSVGRLLVKPPPPSNIPQPPPPSGSGFGGKKQAGTKRASFSSTVRANDGGESKLLSNKHRQSFALPQATSKSLWSNSSGDGDGASVKGSGASQKKKSLLSMLEEEILEELNGEEQRLSQLEGQRRSSEEAVSANISEDDLVIDEFDIEEVEEEEPAEDYDGDAEESRMRKPVSDDEEEDVVDEEVEVDEIDEDDEPPPSDEEEGEEGEAEHKQSGASKPHAPPPPPPPLISKAVPPPPPPPPLAAPLMKSALGEGLLGALKSGSAGAGLKKVDPPAEAKLDDRSHLLRAIQLGSSQLKASAVKPKPFQKIDVKQNEAVAAILANRSKIAGSDSESSDDSDSDYTDDDY